MTNSPVNQASKEIYLIVECDAHSSIDSYRIKQMSASKKAMEKLFIKLAPEFLESNEDGWILKLLEHESAGTDDDDVLGANVLRNANEIRSTEAYEDGVSPYDETYCVAVFCSTSSGPLTGVVYLVECTESEHDNGNHYDLAKEMAMENDYEGPFVAIDEEDDPSLIEWMILDGRLEN